MQPIIDLICFFDPFGSTGRFEWLRGPQATHHGTNKGGFSMQSLAELACFF
jgi:hypothetical protein